MPDYIHGDRQFTATTALGPNVLLLRAFSGIEAISHLFHFRLEMQAVNGTDVPFDKLLGQKVALRIELENGKQRYISGICSRVSEGVADATFTPYVLDMVPQLWFLTRIAQSRIFQQMTVPDILRKVLTGLDVEYQLEGTFLSRDYCVQYRETDFNFVSRLMEEEGIFYFFKHTQNGHQLVLANTPQGNPDLPFQNTIEFENSEVGDREGNRIITWEKSQELRPVKFTLRDHCFELPHKTLDADKLVTESVQVGSVNHKLKLGSSDKLEIYDYPGEYAQRFDGIDPSGGDRSSDLQHIFEDNKRTVEIRMQEDAASGITIHGSGRCRYLSAGYKFSLKHLTQAEGPYVLVSVHHSGRLGGDYRSQQGTSESSYSNTFTCIPAGLPYRPRRITPRPVVHGTQTAIVVGPAGEEIFCDKYSRVKVQFHWDRQGTHDINSSCWIRVGTLWAGTQWGSIHIPRIGQEVIVAFEEGDPDRPIIVGSVYNAHEMPPYALPDNKTQSGIKSRSTLHGTSDNFNELRFEDKKGSEQIYFHAERDFERVVENNDTQKIGFSKKSSGDQKIEIFNNQTLKVGTPQCADGSQSMTIFKDATSTVGKDENHYVTVDRYETVGGNRHIMVKGQAYEKVAANKHLNVGADYNQKTGGSMSLTVGENYQEKAGMKHAVDAGMEIHLKGGMNVTIEAGMQLTLKGPGGFIDIGPEGVVIQGTMVMINSGGAAGSGSGSSPTSPEDAKEAKKTS